jgi:3-carboxy-cis,cis-muconate cycloisomerase
MIGRSNLQQAVPLTFGYKAAVWLAGVDRHIQRLDQLRRRVLPGESGGAVGTLASLGEQGLPVQQGCHGKTGTYTPTDLLAYRARHHCGSWLLSWDTVRLAGQDRLRCQGHDDDGTERGARTGWGRRSRSIAHDAAKRNPISCAYITACSSVVRQQTASLLSAMNADFERVTGTWEIEWLVLPEMFCLSAGALAQAKYLLSGLVVHPENMKKNLQLTDGLINTEAIMMALGPKMGRGKAHDRLAAISIAVSQGKGRLIDLLSNDPEIVQILDRSAIERLMEPTNYLGNSGAMVDRVLAGRGH